MGLGWGTGWIVLRWSAMNCVKMECGTGLGTRWQSWATMPPTPPTLCYWYCTLLVPRTSPNAPQPMHQHQSALSTAHHKTPGQTWWPAGVLPPPRAMQCCYASYAALVPRDFAHPSVNALSVQEHDRETLVREGGGQAGGMHHAPPHSLQSRVPGHHVAPMQALWPPTHAPTRMWQSDGCTVCSVSCSAAAAAAMANAC